MSSRQRIFVLALCLLSTVIAVLTLQNPAVNRVVKQKRSDASRSEPAALQQEFRGLKIPSMVHQNSRDGALVPTIPTKIAEATALIGQTPFIPKDANPMVRSVAEAIETQKYPERLHPLIAPKPFDKNAYKLNPQAYLDIVEPGRVFHPAPPGPGVPRLTTLSPLMIDVPQKETISLKVRGVPDAPVTFTSFDLGAFQNQLTSITVAADSTGIAVARFTGTPGTVNAVNILAASPMSSGTLKFRVNVIVSGLQNPNTVATK